MSNIPDKVFILPGYRTTLMQADDEAELQTLLDKCVDYSQLVTGSPTKPSAAASLLTDCPEGRTSEDKILIGISSQEHGLVGVLDAIRDYPTLNDWWLGLLLLDPAQRNKGLGRRIYQAFEHWAGQQGARRIFLGVVEDNQKAYQFWQVLGFEIIERQPVRQFGPTKHVVIVMARNLAS